MLLECKILSSDTDSWEYSDIHHQHHFVIQYNQPKEKQFSFRKKYKFLVYRTRTIIIAIALGTAFSKAKL